MDIPMNEAALTTSAWAIIALGVFVVAYALVLFEETTELRKSKPLVVAAGLIWILVALGWNAVGRSGVEEALVDVLVEFAELFLFLLAAMTFVNTLQERGVFDVVRARLVSKGYSFVAIFWITGLMAFFMSPVLDNLTTALVMGAVAVALGRGLNAFIVPACINIVVAANAGGAFSPFGDVTTLMVWQAGKVEFLGFFALFLPSLANWLVPALLMSMSIPKGAPAAGAEEAVLRPYALLVMIVFLVTILFTVFIHQFLHLPAFFGMMTGMGALAVLGYFIRHDELSSSPTELSAFEAPPGFKPAKKPFDIFISMKRAEWDTLLFFYGVIFCVGGLSALGLLNALSGASFESLGPTVTNVLVGVASAVIDNIPIMFAVLDIDPELSQGQWLLVTLTAGVGGSLLSIGSAAGVALMGQARGIYTFSSHLKWTWAVALGYAASVGVHFLVNKTLF